jgi:hypothetical protein
MFAMIGVVQENEVRIRKYKFHHPQSVVRSRALHYLVANIPGCGGGPVNAGGIDFLASRIVDQFHVFLSKIARSVSF